MSRPFCLGKKGMILKKTFADDLLDDGKIKKLNVNAEKLKM